MKRWLVCSSVLLGCAAASPSDAAPAESTPSTGQRAVALTVAPISSGAAVGANRPSQLERLRHALSRSPQNVRVISRGKYQIVDMGGTFQTATVVVHDGKKPVQRICLDDASQLDSLTGSGR